LEGTTAAAATTSAAEKRRRVRRMRAAAEAAPKLNRKQTPIACRNSINTIITCIANCMLTSISLALTVEHWQRKGWRIRVRAADEGVFGPVQCFSLFFVLQKKN
jgi:hypothetical protein